MTSYFPVVCDARCGETRWPQCIHIILVKDSDSWFVYIFKDTPLATIPSSLSKTIASNGNDTYEFIGYEYSDDLTLEIFKVYNELCVDEMFYKNVFCFLCKAQPVIKAEHLVSEILNRFRLSPQ